MESIFGDRENLIKIWLDERRSRDFSAKLMWENIKNMSFLIGALITADIALMNFLVSIQTHEVFLVKWLLLFPFLPVMIIIMSHFAENDLKKRWRRVLEAITHLIKMEDLLGLYKKPPIQFEIFKNDEYLFERWKENASKYSSSKEFINGELSPRGVKRHSRQSRSQRETKNKDYEAEEDGNIYTFMKNIYVTTTIIGSSLVIVHVYLIVALVGLPVTAMLERLLNVL